MQKQWLIAVLVGAGVLGGCQTSPSAPTPTSTETTVLPKTLTSRAIEIVRKSLRHENPFIRTNAIEVVAETQQQDMMAEIYAQALSEMDGARRAELFREIFTIVADERVYVHLFQLENMAGVANSIDWSPRPDEYLWMFEAKPAN